MTPINRWVLLAHFGAPGDPQGIHYDLLLEDGRACRTWRLDRIPDIDGASLSIVPLAPHKLSWLEKREDVVSGGRGWVRRVYKGIFIGSLPIDDVQPIQVYLQSDRFEASLEINNQTCWFRPFSSTSCDQLNSP